MTLQLVPSDLSHVEAIGTICYEAFRVVQERHGLLPDWPSAAAAQQGLRMMVDDPRVFGVVALRDGHVVGSNFVSLQDELAGIGPLTVAPAEQGQGIGRALMTAVMDHALEHGFSRLRLQQDAANMASLALYASLGFAVKETTVVMEAELTGSPAAGVRPCTTDDLVEIARLGKERMGVSRANEVAAAIEHGFTVLANVRDERITGYFIAGRRGHGVAETTTDMLALVGEAARRLAPQPVRFFCPLSDGELFRQLLTAGCRAGKVMTLMALGPYEAPRSVWLPSVLG